MKKRVYLVLSALLLLMVVTACGSKETEVKPKQTEDVSSRKSININSEGLPEEYLEIVETAALYVKGELKDEDKEIKQTGISTEFGDLNIRYQYDYGYALMDINGDGIDEILLGHIDTGNVYNIYTIKDGKALLVAAAEGMDDYHIAEDGTIRFCDYYQDGAIDVDAFYDFDGENLNFKEAISAHLVSGSIYNYRVTEEDFLDESNEVSNDEYLDLINKYPSKDIEFTSFIKNDLNKK